MTNITYKSLVLNMVETACRATLGQALQAKWGTRPTIVSATKVEMTDKDKDGLFWDFVVELPVIDDRTTYRVIGFVNSIGTVTVSFYSPLDAESVLHGTWHSLVDNIEIK